MTDPTPEDLLKLEAEACTCGHDASDHDDAADCSRCRCKALDPAPEDLIKRKEEA